MHFKKYHCHCFLNIRCSRCFDGVSRSGIIVLINNKMDTKGWIKNQFAVFFFFYIVQNVLSLSSKIGNPDNTNFQAAETTLFTTTLDPTTSTTFTISFTNAMPTGILEGAIGVVGTQFSFERRQGWSLYISIINQTEMKIDAWSYYLNTSNSSMISFMKIRYVVSCHLNLDIDYTELTFNSTDNLTDPTTYDQSCQYIRCRKKVVNINYGNAKSTLLGITGVPFLAGFTIIDVPANGQLIIPTSSNWGTTWTFSNYTDQNYYGVSVWLAGFQSTFCQLTIAVYGLAKLEKISLYYFTYQTSLTNTYTTRAISGISDVGCYYDGGGCTLPWKIVVKSNSTFATSSTFIKSYIDNIFFYGLRYFIIYHNEMDPTISMNFDSISSNLKPTTDIYETTISFSGNPSGYFSFKFAYFLDVNFTCPSSGDVYHINSTHCDANCPSNFYPDATNYCQRCSSRCRQCTGPTNSQCRLSCYTSAHNRILNDTTCICKPLYYFDNGLDVCANCSYTCLSCYAAGSSNCLTCDPTDFRYSDNASSCPCNPGYFDNGGKTCVKCHFTCATCTGGANANNCLTCTDILTTYRNISSNQCVCIAGYFSTTSVVCNACHYSCKTCQTTSTNCLSCEATNKRSINNVSCDCNAGFYNDGFNALCPPCHITCKTCNGPAATDCSSCWGNQSRSYNAPTGECLCQTGFYNFNNTCIACHYTCLNCTLNTPTSCINCDAGKFRTKNTTTNECPCNNGYFDLLSTPSTPTCQVCQPTCLTCQINSTRCLSCSAIDKRQLISNSCPCISGYAEFNGTCHTCNYSCITCTGLLSTECLTCNMTQRFPNGTSCLCRPGTYDDGMQVVCQPCHIHCLECTGGTNDTCTVCDASMQRFAPATVPNFCFCAPHYYNTGPAACSVCFSKCETCEYSSTYCLACYASQFRTPTANHTCECMPGYYETGADICQPCSSRCFECSVISTNCTTCPVLRTFVNSTCVCVDNYYEDTVSGNCLQCGDLCRLCQSSSTQCTDCYPSMNRYLSSLQCVCNYGFYNDSTNVDCLPCPYYCQNCSSPTVCLDCSPALFRTMNGTMCSCMLGYYDNGGSAACLACSPICKQCSDYAVCTDCEATLQRSLTLTDCPCVGKFYSIYSLATPTTMCQPCHYSCATCTGGNSMECITCETLRNFTNYSCPCNSGFYESLQLCYPCDPICRTCEGIPTNCTSCFSGLPLANNTCLCYSGQFLSGSLCYPCDPKCKQCVGVATFCTDCWASHLTIFLSNDCICPPGTYKDNVTLICNNCDITCLQCTGPSGLECTDCNATSSINRILNINKCICKTNYYLDGSSQACNLCHNSCINCLGPSQYNCSSCQTGFTLIASYCKPDLTCPNYRYEGQCVNVCPKNSYPTALHTCEKCINGCLYCMTATVCLECLTGYVYNSATATCVAFCSTGTYMSPAGSCIACSANCLECQWNSVKNQEVCLKCASSYFIRDSQCSLTCLAPRYYALGSICLRCLGNCETCNSLSASDCVLCKNGTSFLAGQCYQVCPGGYYLKEHLSSQNTCEPCPNSCSSCINGECLSCSTSYHLSNGKCVENGFFYDKYDKENKVLQKCHPNCLSCTNTSFSSCILCRPHRGDSSEMAVSGYCECHESSIDMGNGVCDYQKFAELLKVTESLVSYSSSTFFLTALTSIVSTNCVGMIAMLAYVQAYSNFYFLNSSLVMNVDYVLKEYRKANINSYLHMQSEPVASRRALVELQNDKSLFMRDQPYKYFVEWALLPIILISIGWLISLLAFHIKVKMKQYKKRLVVQKIQLKRLQTNESIRSNQQGLQRHIKKIKQKDRNREKTVDQCLQQLDKQQEDVKLKIGKYAEKFFKYFHQNFFVIFQLVFSSQLIFYACASFKIMKTSNSSIQTTKLVFSIFYFLYFVLYTFRMLIGIFRFSRKCQSLKDKSKENEADEKKQNIKDKEIGRNPISVLLHMHLPQKNGPMYAIYLPLTLLRNQIMGVLVVFLSANPNNQIMSCAIVFSIFTLYSLIFCPYKTMFRIFLHISEVVFVLQIIMLSAVSKMEYSQGYSLNILDVDGSYYNLVWALVFLNYLQIILYGLFAISILLHLTIQKFCKRFKNKNKKELKNEQKQVKEKENLVVKKNKKVKNLLTNQQQSTDNFIFCLDQEKEKQYVQPNDEPNFLNIPVHQREQSQSTTIPMQMPRRKPIPHRQIESNNSYLTMNQNNSENNDGDTKQQKVVRKRYRVKDKRTNNSRNSFNSSFEDQQLYFSEPYDPQNSELPYQQLQTIETGSFKTQKKK